MNVLREQEGPATPAATAADVLLRRLSRYAELSSAEGDLVRAVTAATARQHPPGSQLYGEDTVHPPRLVLSGWACRQRALLDGRRQIVSLLLPGDLVGPVLEPRLPAPCAVTALTRVETVDGAALVAGTGAPGGDGPSGPERSGLLRALHAVDRENELLLTNQVLRQGRQTALERVLHLLLELRDRLGQVGLGTPDRFPMPLTQETLADVLGLSAVHVNRTLKQIRGAGLAEVKGGVVTMRRPDLAQAAADWDVVAQLAPDGAGGKKRRSEGCWSLAEPTNIRE